MKFTAFLLFGILYAFSLHSQTNKVLVYGIVNDTSPCGKSLQFKNYEYAVVNASDVSATERKFRSDLENRYPGAEIKVNNSAYDYGKSANNVCFLSFSKIASPGFSNCKIRILMVAFGKTQEEAYRRVIENKNAWGGADDSGRIETARNWD
jgi:hypothetical protein